MRSIRMLRPLLTAALVTWSITAVSAAVAAGATAPIQVCGTVSNYVAPTALTDGVVTINGQTVSIAHDATINGKLSVGSNACVTASLDDLLRANTMAVTANSETTATWCGVVSSFVEPSASSPGQIGIGDQSFKIAQRAAISGSTQAGEDVCATLTFNGLGGVDAAKLAQNPTAPQINSPLTLNASGSSAGQSSASSGSTGQAGASNGQASLGAGGRTPGRFTANADGSANVQSLAANSAPGSGAGSTAPQAAPRGGGAVGPLPDTATFARVLDLTARTAVPLGVIGLGLLSVGGLALLRRKPRSLGQ